MKRGSAITRRAFTLGGLATIAGCSQPPKKRHGETTTRPSSRNEPGPAVSATDADEIEERLWNESRLGFYGQDREQALQDVNRALAARKQTGTVEEQIWVLSLKLEVLRYERTRESAALAAKTGEDRLRLRRQVLEHHPRELISNLKEQAALYKFKGELLDPSRSTQLLAEAEALAKRTGEHSDGR